MRKLAAPVLAIALLSSCSNETTSDLKADSTKNSGPDFLASNIDSTVNPAEDFFMFANGRWFKNNPIPPTESAWGIGRLVYEDILVKTRKVNEDAAKAGGSEGSDTQKIGDFWATAMDSAKAEKLGASPLEEKRKLIDGIANANDAVRVAAEINRLGTGAFWSFHVDQDPKNSSKISVLLYQGGLGLPERDFYFNKDSGIAAIRNEYPAHIANMLRLAGKWGDKQAMEMGEKVVAFEKNLAQVSRTKEKMRDDNANYNKMSVADFTAKYGAGIDWKGILNSYRLSADTIIVGQPEFFSGMSGLVRRTDPAVLRAYLDYHFISTYAPYLNKALDDEHFRFYGTVVDGQDKQRPRWKRVLDAEEEAMGMLLGKIFVKEYFPEKTRKRYSDMVEAIRDVYRDHITRLDWMSEATKARALDKLEKMTKKVGYPDKWKDYSALKIGRASYAQNMMNAADWYFNDRISRYGKPVDRSEWTMTPQTYNAYYNPSNNEIVLPAAIFLITGVKDDEADDAMIYGYAAASTIGHEITHGFDDSGRRYDAEGNLSEWWTKEDEAEFVRRASVMARQFDAYEPLPGMHINGNMTLGENLADFGGVVLGLEAFKKTEQYKKGEKIAGLTPVQRYFLGYALGWLSHSKEARLRQRLLSDEHSPAKWRVNGPFANIPEFYEAFGVKEGDPMWRPDSLRVKIW